MTNQARFCFVFLSLLVFSSFTALAQLELNTKLDHRAYLQFEPVVANTEIRSRIGQPVIFNSSSGTGPVFYYEVRDDFGNALPLLPGTPVPDPVLVGAQDRVTLTNDMTRLFAMARTGQYSIQPCVDWMGKTYRGEKRHVEVVSGREIARITGVVADEQTTRTYMIFHINRGQQDHMLLRIDDEVANICYGVYPLGRSVMNEKPELAVDSQGRAHVLFQSAPRTYTHATFSPRGGMVDAQTFGRDYSRISLKSQPNGSIEAIGSREQRRGPPMVNSIIDNR